jgi:hypothetical protein
MVNFNVKLNSKPQRHIGFDTVDAIGAFQKGMSPFASQA